MKMTKDASLKGSMSMFIPVCPLLLAPVSTKERFDRRFLICMKAGLPQICLAKNGGLQPFVWLGSISSTK